MGFTCPLTTYTFHRNLRQGHYGPSHINLYRHFIHVGKWGPCFSNNPQGSFIWWPLPFIDGSIPYFEKLWPYPHKGKVTEKKNIMGLIHQNNVLTNIVPPHITDKELKTPQTQTTLMHGRIPNGKKVGSWYLAVRIYKWQRYLLMVDGIIQEVHWLWQGKNN